MSHDPRILITGHGASEGLRGQTIPEWNGLFAALAVADPAERGAAVMTAIGAAVPATRLDVEGIYRRQHAKAKGAKSPVRSPHAGGRGR